MTCLISNIYCTFCTYTYSAISDATDAAIIRQGSQKWTSNWIITSSETIHFVSKINIQKQPLCI